MSLEGNVMDLAVEAKKSRAHKKAGFTRNHSTFQCLVDAKVQESILKGAYKNMGQVYEALDKALES